MPPWFLTFLIQTVLPAILQAAYESGLINLAEKEVIKFGMSIKTYAEYPTGKNGQQDSPQPAVINITIGAEEKDNQFPKGRNGA